MIAFMFLIVWENVSYILKLAIFYIPVPEFNSFRVFIKHLYRSVVESEDMKKIMTKSQF